jgi:hypothetical protein
MPSQPSTQPPAGIKKSAILAFCELLNAIKNGDDVLLLTSSDAAAHGAFQEYNDLLHTVLEEQGNKAISTPVEKYRQFVDKLAVLFDTQGDGGGFTRIPQMRTRDVLQDAADVIASIMKSPYVSGLTIDEEES